MFPLKTLSQVGADNLRGILSLILRFSINFEKPNVRRDHLLSCWLLSFSQSESRAQLINSHSLFQGHCVQRLADCWLGLAKCLAHPCSSVVFCDDYNFSMLYKYDCTAMAIAVHIKNHSLQD